MYDFGPLYASGLDGTGQTLALFELASYDAADITAYETAFGLPAAPLVNVSVDGGCGNYCSYGADEVTLDIELQLAVAPDARAIEVYEGPNSDAGVVDTYARIAADDTATSVSTSWGLCEQVGSEFTSRPRTPASPRWPRRGRQSCGLGR